MVVVWQGSQSAFWTSWIGFVTLHFTVPPAPHPAGRWRFLMEPKSRWATGPRTGSIGIQSYRDWFEVTCWYLLQMMLTFLLIEGWPFKKLYWWLKRLLIRGVNLEWSFRNDADVVGLRKGCAFSAWTQVLRLTIVWWFLVFSSNDLFLSDLGLINADPVTHSLNNSVMFLWLDCCDPDEERGQPTRQSCWRLFCWK